MTDLFKAFDCLPRELIIAKLNAFGFYLAALKLMNDYLSEKRPGTKISHSYSSWEDILFGVPQGSILGPIICNIFFSDLFLILIDTEFASYADDNTIYKEADVFVITSLQNTAKKLLEWFSNNQIKEHTDKCNLLRNI